jgi:hypothetical protein
MDRMQRLIQMLKTLIDCKFSGYIKINFSQGSLGRVEKSEEFVDAAVMLEGEKRKKKGEVEDLSDDKL